MARERDACQTCHGTRGGVPGNENGVMVNGIMVIMCDYCCANDMWGDANYREGVQARHKERQDRLDQLGRVEQLEGGH